MTNETKDWEERFDTKFKKTLCNCVIERHYKGTFCPSETSFYNITKEDIKSFIRTEKENSRKEVLDELLSRLPEEYEYPGEILGRPERYGFNDARSKILKIIKELRG